MAKVFFPTLQQIPSICALVLLACFANAYGETPIVTTDQNSANNTPSSDNLSSLPPAQRLRLLENKIQFLEQANVVQDLSQLRDNLQRLQGLIEVQGHDLAQLKKQQTDFYRDVDRRLEQLKPQPAQTTDAANPKPVAVNQQQDKPQEASANLATKVSVPAVAVTNNTAATATPAAAATSQLATPAAQPGVSAQKAYEQAFHLVSARKFAQATVAFQQFIQQYPNSRYAGNAHYWLGELDVQTGDRAKAQEEFKLVKNQFPDHNKVPDALLKLGILAKADGDIPQARGYFNELIKKYQGTTAAQLATLQLRRLT